MSKSIFNVKDQTTLTPRDSALVEYLRQIPEPLTRAEEEDLYHLFGTPSEVEARQKLLDTNQRFYVSAAKAFYYPSGKYQLLDLIQVAYLGAHEASLRFNPDNGNRFISYSIHWVRQALTQYFNSQSKMIREPVNISYIRRIVNKIRLEFLAENEYEPSLNDIIDDPRLDPLPDSGIAHCFELHRNNVGSLDRVISHDEGTTFLDMVESEPNQEVNIFKCELERELESVLSPKEFLAITATYCLFNTVGLSKGSIAELLDVSAVSVGTILKGALNKLRNSPGILRLLNP